MQPRGEFRVSVTKDYLVFASAHFITFRGHQCESLHGHNYRVGVMVEGAVDDECLFVLDFSILKKIVRKLVDRIDHKVLLPTNNPKLAYRHEGDYDHAIQDYSQAIRLKPDFVEVYVNRGVTYHRMRDHERAIADFSTSILTACPTSTRRISVSRILASM